MEDSFQVIIDSLGHYSLGALLAADIEEIRIWPDEVDRAARMELCLRDDNWDARAAAIRAMTEVREVFLEELSIEYSFGPSGDTARRDAAERTRVFAA